MPPSEAVSIPGSLREKEVVQPHPAGKACLRGGGWEGGLCSKGLPGEATALQVQRLGGLQGGLGGWSECNPPSLRHPAPPCNWFHGPVLLCKHPEAEKPKLWRGAQVGDRRGCFLNCNLHENFHLQANWEVHASHLQLLWNLQTLVDAVLGPPSESLHF